MPRPLSRLDFSLDANSLSAQGRGMPQDEVHRCVDMIRASETQHWLAARWLGESQQQVRDRFRRMVAEGRANENDAYIIFRWQW
jgi:hypothetical protein